MVWGQKVEDPGSVVGPSADFAVSLVYWRKRIMWSKSFPILNFMEYAQQAYTSTMAEAVYTKLHV